MSALMRYIGVRIQKNDGQWEGIDDFQEIEKTDFS
jgi:hypothetical protein